MKIFSTPCESGPAAWRHADVALRALHAQSQPRLHELVEDPGEADYIFISNIKPDGYQRALRHHPLFPRYLHKTFAFTEAWNMPFLLAGVYVNATQGLDFGRFKTGSYALHHPDFKNPYIEAFQPGRESARRPDLLFSFLGRNCHSSRERLFATPFRRPDVLVEDTSRFNAFSHTPAGKEADQRRYYEICLRSKFILCPRGVGASSIRLFEALRLGIAPIIVSDAWKPCEGPDWASCALFVRERDIHRVEEIAASHESRYAEMGAAARKVHEQFFAESAYFNFLVRTVDTIARQRLIPERVFYWTWPLRHFADRVRRRWERVNAGSAPQVSRRPA